MADAIPSLVAGLLLSWFVMFVRVLVMVLFVNRSLLAALLLPFGAMAVVTILIAWHFHRASPARPDAHAVPLKNPFSLTQAAKFAAFFAVVLLVVKLAQAYAPESGMYFVAGLAGMTDVDAITLSMAQFAGSGGAPGVAVNAITLAALTNTVVKAGMAVTLGGHGLRRPMLVSAPIIVAAGAVALFLA
jgi:uncharacterized membrane protein (DUF4010 family)